jgi:hypothetical protein
MLKKLCQALRKTICLVMGHNQTAVVCASNEHSTWGYFHCSRCKDDEAFQYDYN